MPSRRAGKAAIVGKIRIGDQAIGPRLGVAVAQRDAESHMFAMAGSMKGRVSPLAQGFRAVAGIERAIQRPQGFPVYRVKQRQRLRKAPCDKRKFPPPYSLLCMIEAKPART